jgi:hypothetical protein
MALTFAEDLDIPPVPTDDRRAARQALALSRSVARAGSLAAAKAAAVQVILDASPADPPSELRRLRLLSQKAYTVPEL